MSTQRYRTLDLAINESNEQLLEMIRSEGEAVLRTRLMALQLYVSGQCCNYSMIAEQLGVHRRSVRLWFTAYSEAGLEGLLRLAPRGNQPGRLRVFTPEAVAQVVEELNDPKGGFDSYGQVQARFSALMGRPQPNPAVPTTQCPNTTTTAVTFTYPYVVPAAARIGAAFVHSITPELRLSLLNGDATTELQQTSFSGGTPPNLLSGDGINTGLGSVTYNLTANSYSAEWDLYNNAGVRACRGAIKQFTVTSLTTLSTVNAQFGPTSGDIQFTVDASIGVTPVNYRAEAWLTNPGVGSPDRFRNLCESFTQYIFSGLQAGQTYTLWFITANGCTTVTTAQARNRLESTSYATPEVRLYPNPAREHTLVEYDFGNAEGGDLEVTDLTGRRIGSWKLEGMQGSIEVNLHGWAEGVYVCTVRSSTGMLKTFKLAVTR